MKSKLFLFQIESPKAFFKSYFAPDPLKLRQRTLQLLQVIFSFLCDVRQSAVPAAASARAEPCTAGDCPEHVVSGGSWGGAEGEHQRGAPSGGETWKAKSAELSKTTDHIPLGRWAHCVTFRLCAICVSLSKLLHKGHWCTK